MTTTNRYHYGVFILSFLFISFSCKSIKEPFNDQKNSSRYTIIIDAGSSSSKLNVYKITIQPGNEIATIDLKNQKDKSQVYKVDSITEFLNNPIKASENIKLLISTAKKIIPQEKLKSTQLYLLATAGLRLKNDKERNKILTRAVKVINDEKTFQVNLARTISGRYEGLYGWLALNYADLKSSKNNIKGILEMGGGSTQIAFQPSTQFVDFKLQRKINGKVYDIYSRSFLGFGDKSVEKLVNSSDCYFSNSPRGIIPGTGNYDGCAKNLLMTLKNKCKALKNKCLLKNSDQCSLPYCIFGGKGIPNNNDQLIAVSGFSYVLDYLGLNNNINLKSLKKEAVNLCSKNYNNLSNKNIKYTPDYCWKSTFYYLLLHDAYQLPANSKVNIYMDYNGWTLGAVLDIEMGYLPEQYIGN